MGLDVMCQGTPEERRVDLKSHGPQDEPPETWITQWEEYGEWQLQNLTSFLKEAREAKLPVSLSRIYIHIYILE